MRQYFSFRFLFRRAVDHIPELFEKIQQQLESIPISGPDNQTAREQLSGDIEEFFDWIVAATVSVKL